LLFFVIFWQNFPFGVWLSGWDNLHPEFNFLLNFKRSFSAVWQSNQGLGTFGGHGYAATLPHTIITYILSLFVPIMYVRSAFTFLMLFSGSLGIFFLIRQLLNKHNGANKSWSAFFGAVFYIINLATIQNFFIQLEAFIIHFAVLPWLFLLVLKIFESPKKTRVGVFMILSFFASAQGFIPPLFLVYLMMLSLLLFGMWLVKPSIKCFFKAVLVALITFITNAYWFIPFVYYTLTNSQVYLNAYSNFASTEDFILKNIKYGNLANVTLLKGFILESIDTVVRGRIIRIFELWLEHLNNPIVSVVGYLLFGFIVAGLLILLRPKYRNQILGLFLGFLLIFSFMANSTFPFSLLTDILQKVPALRQAFRITFTKFSIALSFYYSIFFGLGLFVVFGLLKKIKKQLIGKALKILIPILVLAGLVFYIKPLFQGQLFYQRAKVVIPSSYFDLYNFFDKQDKTERIADFPQGWHWGWTVTEWGYSGSGFLWYGIEQPIIHRSFDAWGQFNENYYWEMSNALFSRNYDLLAKVFDKYKISWVVFDKNLISYPNPRSYIYANYMEDFLNNSNLFSLKRVFKASNHPSAKDISVYKYVGEKKRVELLPLSELEYVGPEYSYTDYDTAFVEFGNYISSDKPHIYYPFRELFSKRNTGQITPQVSLIENKLRFSTEIPANYTKKELVKGSTFKKDQLRIEPINDQLSRLIVDVKLKGNLVFDSAETGLAPDQSENSSEAAKQMQYSDYLRLVSVDTDNIYPIDLPSIEQRYGYIIFINSQHVSGKALRLAIINRDARKTDSEIALKSNGSNEYVVIPPMKRDGIGYRLVFNNISIGNQETINNLSRVVVVKIPYFQLKELKFSNQKQKTNSEQVVVLNESFNEDWKLYIDGREESNKVMVNNWANGWKINRDELNKANLLERTKVVFWPQRLSQIGFLLLFLLIPILFNNEIKKRLRFFAIALPVVILLGLGLYLGISGYFYGYFGDVEMQIWQSFNLIKVVKQLNPILYDSFFGAPNPYALSLSSVLQNSSIMLMYFLTKNIYIAYNFSVFFFLSLNYISMYWVLDKLNFPKRISFLGSLIFLLAPTTLIHSFAHPSVYITFIFPLFFYFLYKLHTDWKFINWIQVVSVLALSFYVHEYYALILAISFIVFLIFNIKQILQIKNMKRMFLAGFYGLFILSFFIWLYWGKMSFDKINSLNMIRSIEEAERFSSSLTNYFFPANNNPFYSGLPINLYQHKEVSERLNYLGIVNILAITYLIIFVFLLNKQGQTLRKLFINNRKLILVFTVTGMISLFLSFGPFINIGALKVKSAIYYLATAGIFPFSSVRAYGRYGFIIFTLTTFLTVLVFRETRLKKFLKNSIVFVLLILIVIIDQLPNNKVPFYKISTPDYLKTIANDTGDFYVLNTPFSIHYGGLHNSTAQFFQIFHKKKIVNGYASFLTPVYKDKIEKSPIKCLHYPEIFFPDCVGVLNKSVLKELNIKYIVFEKKSQYLLPGVFDEDLDFEFRSKTIEKLKELNLLTVYQDSEYVIYRAY
jgi:hypothetical protein